MPLWRSLEREYPPTTGNHWLRAVERGLSRYIMRAAPVPASADSDSISADASGVVDSCEARTPRPRDNVSCGDDVVVITHIDGRRFPNPEQREERGLPAHIPKYDA
jgi:hypothetical protein